MTDTTKNILIGGIIIVVLFAAFKLLVSKKEEPEISSSVVTERSFETKTFSATREAALTLQKIKSIEVDTEVFSSEAFKSLKDFRVNILPEAVGRDNPFAPVE